MPDKNGDLFQAPPRRDNVSPFEPASGGHDPHEDSDIRRLRPRR